MTDTPRLLVIVVCSFLLGALATNVEKNDEYVEGFENAMAICRDGIVNR